MEHGILLAWNSALALSMKDDRCRPASREIKVFEALEEYIISNVSRIFLNRLVHLSHLCQTGTFVPLVEDWYTCTTKLHQVHISSEQSR